VGALSTRYAPVFEYMFVFSKGRPKTFNPIKDRKNKHAGQKVTGTIRQAGGSFKPMSNQGKNIQEFGQRFNIWDIVPQRGNVGHPAPFPYQIAHDHIISWSNEGDVVLDPFMGSGTTGVASKSLNRDFIGIEMDEEYFLLAKSRIDGIMVENTLEDFFA